MTGRRRGDSGNGIDETLVRRLIASQCPQWAHLSVRPVEVGGWDNRTFRLGGQMSVRLPSARAYAAQVEKEQRWLPELAPRLPLPIPEPLAMGEPELGFPWRWSVYRWLEGAPATPDRIGDLEGFAVDLAAFLVALQRIDGTGGPPPGPHNFHRGGPLAVYDDETQQALAALCDRIDTAAAGEVWRVALASTPRAAPVWVHGDVAAGNLLVRNGRLCAVIDFGCSAVGDPACDLVIAWTLLRGGSRRAFRSTLQLDDAAWARGRGWALWKALITLARREPPGPAAVGAAKAVIDEVLADHQAAG